MISQKHLKSLLDYNPETGSFTWKKSKGRVKAGSIAGGKSLGYLAIGIDGQVYYAHRLAWLYAYGVLPSEQIDHVNGNRADNRLANLRSVTHAENGQNQKHGTMGRSGYRGVYLLANGKYLARIKNRQKDVRLGIFSDPIDAYRAYLQAKSELHPFRRSAG